MALRKAVLSLAACAGLAAGCGADDGGSPMRDEPASAYGGADAAPAEPSAPARRGPLVKLRDSQFGPVLFSGGDRALYLFTRDAKRKSRCYGDCAVAWPPFYAKGRPRAARGVDAALLGTIERRDGRRQVTYRGQPLYFYVDDPKRQVLCNDVAEFGGTWFALDAAGDPPA
jgi:predicted lipoprotein with Yx(FWY)xxD motif